MGLRIALPDAEARPKMRRRVTPAMRIGLPRLRAVAAAVWAALALTLALMLGGGNGLPGLVRTLADADAHVCTCATGGSHASCPVCNHALQASPRTSGSPSVQGLPCGDRGVAAAAVGELATLPPSLVSVVPVARRLAALTAEGLAPPDRLLEPATPPPRSAHPG
jgi:hypothetical protein